METEGYASLLRIERGRIRNRDVFGPIRLQYGMFQVKTAAFDNSEFSDLIRRRPDIGVVIYRNLAADISTKLKGADLNAFRLVQDML